jgi:hypothetical protein
MEKKLKVGVRVGSGPAPGYLWNVILLDLAFRDAMKFLTMDQYCHLAEQFRQLARENDPTHSQTAQVRQIESFWELRDKHGPLRNINVRVFFFLEKESRAIVVLGTIKKENDGPTHAADKIRMRRRQRLCVEGGLGMLPL